MTHGSRRNMIHRKEFIALAALSLLGLVPLNARSADATVSWTNPTQNTDGTPIPATGPGSLTGIELYYGICASGNQSLLPTPVPVSVTVPAPGTSKVITGLGAGTWCFRARSVTSQAMSDWTLYVNKTVPPSVPNPPVLNSTITLAYETWKFSGKTYLGRSVGTIQKGTPCGSFVMQSFSASYYEIDRSSVTFTKVPNPGPIVTQCAEAPVTVG